MDYNFYLNDDDENFENVNDCVYIRQNVDVIILIIIIKELEFKFMLDSKLEGDSVIMASPSEHSLRGS